MSRTFSLPYELRLGIVGHRQVADVAGVRRGIEHVLAEIDRTLNHKTVAPISWTGISALALGADRLFADIVLGRTAGRLEVIAPFPLDEYRKDFQPGADCDEFERLLARAAIVRELEGGQEVSRADAYLRAGEAVVDSCEILVAVWDGRPSPGGGTADVVQYAVTQERLVLWIDSTRADAPLRAVGSVAYADGVIDPSCCSPIPDTPKTLSRGYHEQAKYCLDRVLGDDEYEPAIRKRCDELLKLASTAGLHPSALEPVLERIVPHFVRADQLAQYYRPRYRWSVGGVLYLAAAAVTVALGQLLFFPDRRWLILFEVLGMLMVLVLWSVGRHEAWHEKWLHDRYLAEQLRIATFTALVGAVRPSEGDDPLPFYGGPHHWLALAVLELTESTAALVSQIPFGPLREFIVLAWLQEQQKFHGRTAHDTARRAHRRHWLGIGLFGATLLMAALHFLGVGHAPESHDLNVARLDLWVTFLALVLPVWAAAVHAVTSQLELERVAERSRRMARVLEPVLHRAAGASGFDELRRVSLQAAALMTMENREWWVLLSFQELRLHV